MQTHVIPLARYKYNVNYLGTLNAVAPKSSQMCELQIPSTISCRVEFRAHERLAIGTYEGRGEATSCQKLDTRGIYKGNIRGDSARLIHKLPQTQYSGLHQCLSRETRVYSESTGDVFMLKNQKWTRNFVYRGISCSGLHFVRITTSNLLQCPAAQGPRVMGPR